MSKGSGLAGSAVVMFAGTLTSRALGLVRSALLVAAIFSLGGAADAFSVANKLPNIIYMLIAGGVLNAVLVPQIVRAMRREDGGQEYVNRLLTLAGTVLLAVTVLLTLAAPLLITLYAAEFRQGPWAPVATSFAMFCIPQLFFYGMYTLLGQVLNARSNFGPYMWAPALNNVIAIAGLAIYIGVFGTFNPDNPDPASAYGADRILLLAGTATLGVAAQAAILIVPLVRSGFRFRPVWGIRGSGLGTATRVAWWAFLALLCGQVGYLAVSNLAAAASTAAAQDAAIAGNAAYDVAFMVFMLPQSLITVSLVTAMFTRLSGHAASGDGARVRDDLSLGLRTLGVFTVFAAGALAVLAIPLIQVIQLDVATFEAYRAVGGVLVAMLIGLPAIAIWTMTQRVYFAYEDTKALFYIQIPMAAIQIGGCLATFWLAEPHWWVAGSGLATAASSMFGAVFSFVALRRKLPSLDGSRVLRTYLRLTIALIPAILIGWGFLHLWGVQTTFVGAVLRVVLLGALMGLVYLILLRRLGVDELDGLLARVGGLIEPLTRRLAPVTRRLPGTDRVRTIWDTITGQRQRRGGVRMSTRAGETLVAGEVLSGRYRLVEPVAADSAHTAHWLGVDTILERQVRIVTISSTHREDALDAARRAALISDERLVRILRVGTHDGIGFVVTEVTSGPTLADLLTRGRLHPEQARAIVGEAAAALEVARRRGVHHQQIRPTAIHLDPSWAVRVSGLAFDAAAAGVQPEHARAAARTDAVDLVQLLYAALSATWPGSAELSGGVPASSRDNGAPVPLAELHQDIPHDLDTLCAVTFGPHQDGPYTPGELTRDLEPWPEPGTGPLYAEAAILDEPGTPDPRGAAGPGAGGADQPAPATPYRGLPVGVLPDSGSHAPGDPDRGDLSDPAPLGGGGVAPWPAVPAAAAGAEAGPMAPDTSGWAPQPPPAAGPKPPFDELIRAESERHQPQILDTYMARHERRGPAAQTHSAPPTDMPAAPAQPQVTDGSGATAVAPPGSIESAPADAPPTASPPPGVPDTPNGPAVASTGTPPQAPDAPRGAAFGLTDPATGPGPHGPGAFSAGGHSPGTATWFGAGGPGSGDPASAGAAGTGWPGASGPAGTNAASGPDPAPGSGAGGGAASSAAAVSGALGSAAGTIAGFVVGGSRRAAVGVRSVASKTADSTRRLTSGLRAEPEDESSTEVHTASRPAVASDSDWDEPQADPQSQHSYTAAGLSDSAGGDDDDTWAQADQDRFNPTPVVILTMIAGLIVAGVLAFSSLRDARTSFNPEATTGPTATVEPTEEDEEDEAEPEPEPTETETEEEQEGPPPVIDTARALDPSTGSGDNEELAYLAVDENPDTIWRSLRYNDPQYGMKDGVGLAVFLSEPAIVSEVTIDVQGEGGLVQIRDSDPDSPDQGTVLAEGPMGPEATYELAEPTELGTLVLWFPELPVAESDGRNRIELAEVQVE